VSSWAVLQPVGHTLGPDLIIGALLKASKLVRVVPTATLLPVGHSRIRSFVLALSPLHQPDVVFHVELPIPFTLSTRSSAQSRRCKMQDAGCNDPILGRLSLLSSTITCTPRRKDIVVGICDTPQLHCFDMLSTQTYIRTRPSPATHEGCTCTSSSFRDRCCSGRSRPDDSPAPRIILSAASPIDSCIRLPCNAMFHLIPLGTTCPQHLGSGLVRSYPNRATIET